MKVIIYESSSKGGCYEYSQYLYRAFAKEDIDVTLVIPAKSRLSVLQVKNVKTAGILSNDQTYRSRIVSKIAFLFRQIYNPLRFIIFLIRQPSSVVIWNDFEQLTAPLWAPCMALFTRKHYHVIILHDPDRDQYPPSKIYSQFCMKQIMKRMNLALYHEYLPDKPYYKRGNAEYQSIVHGIFDMHKADESLLKNIQDWKGNASLLSVIGNIRDEKNYHLIIKALAELPETRLVIAGAAANSSVDVQLLKSIAEQGGVSDRIRWEIRFLSEAELSACIQSSDIILLYYKEQFTSQSGILNMLAPYRKQYLYADAQSGLARVSKKYEIGIPCLPDSEYEFVKTLKHAIEFTSEHDRSWDKYLNATDWIHTVHTIQSAYKK